MEKNSFTTQIHTYGKQTLLDETYEMIDNISGLNITLYPNQKTLVRAILDIEQQRFIDVVNEDFYDNVTNSKLKLQYSACVLSEPFGSGKTIIILAIIMSRRIPRPIPYHANTITCQYNMNKFTTEITMRIPKLIRANLIVVASAVLHQWVDAIKTLTNLRYFVIGDVRGMKDFYSIFKDGLYDYDIVLVKNGTLTGTFRLDDETVKHNTNTRPIISVLSKICMGYAWARIIFDDFDTIKLTTEQCNLQSLFTIYVSATRKNERTKHVSVKNINNIKSFISNYSYSLPYIVSDHALFTNLSIANMPEFTEKSINMTKIHGYKYVYNNPDDNYMNLLGAMKEDDANDIMEMLNSDARETAAIQLGIKSSSAADIFERVLDNKYKKYIADAAILKRIADLKEQIINLPRGEEYSASELKEIKRTYKGRRTITLHRTAANLIEYLDTACVDYTKSYEQNGLAINRVKDNIKEGECQVCLLPLEDSNVSIAKCCGLITCDECLSKTFQVAKIRHFGKTQIEGKCPNCMKVVDFRQDIIFINREFNLESLLDDNAAIPILPQPLPEDITTGTIVDANVVTAPEEEKIKNPKMRALYNIIRGLAPENKTEQEIVIKNLLTGKVTKECNVPRKILVFANFGETIKHIETFLQENAIPCINLQGTHQQLQRCIENFRTSGTAVLLVNSSEHCAGLNIQFATDLVFFHKIIDCNIESQVAGRAQRIGRVCDLNIHYLLYNNELNYV